MPMPNTSPKIVITGDADPVSPSLSYLALLGELAQSLEASQHAVLSHDLEQLTRLTAEQNLLANRILPLAQGQTSTYRPTLASQVEADCASEIFSAERRILHLGRVQHVLLQRARQYSQAISNLLAGTDSNYGPPAQNRGIELHSLQPMEG